MFFRPVLLGLFAFALFSLPAAAEELVEESGSASRERRMEHIIDLGERTELTLTLSCSSNAARQGLYRVYFYERSPSGRWSQINELRVQFTGNQEETSGTFYLPHGDYKIVITARFMDYSFLLEDDREPEVEDDDDGSDD